MTTSGTDRPEGFRVTLICFCCVNHEFRDRCMGIRSGSPDRGRMRCLGRLTLKSPSCRYRRSILRLIPRVSLSSIQVQRVHKILPRGGLYGKTWHTRTTSKKYGVLASTPDTCSAATATQADPSNVATPPPGSMNVKRTIEGRKPRR